MQVEVALLPINTYDCVDIDCQKNSLLNDPSSERPDTRRSVNAEHTVYTKGDNKKEIRLKSPEEGCPLASHQCAPDP